MPESTSQCKVVFIKAYLISTNLKPASKELVASLSPYIRGHIRRFGRYDVNMEEFPPDLVPKPVKLTE